MVRETTGCNASHPRPGNVEAACHGPRTIPNPPLVRDDRGEVSNFSPRDVLPRVEVFGQHEISELTKSREKLTRLLDRFVERDDDVPRRKTDLRRALEKSRKSVLDTRAELRQPPSSTPNRAQDCSPDRSPLNRPPPLDKMNLKRLQGVNPFP